MGNIFHEVMTSAYVSAPESHNFSFLQCRDMTLRDGRCPSFRGLSHLCAGSAAAGPPVKVFGRVGHGEGEHFYKIGYPPRNVFPQIFACFQSSGIRLPLCRVTIPLGNDQETTTPVSLPPGTVLLPGSGRHKGLGQALVAQYNTSFLPNKKSPADTGDNQQHSQSGDLLFRAVVATG